jgi:hypothetical protein
MKTTLSALCATLLFAACGNEAGKTPSDPKVVPVVVASDGHGEAKPLGNLTIGKHTFEVIQKGNVEAGHEAAFDLKFPPGQTPLGTVRAWIGVESGEGSMKGKLTKEDATTVHGHVDVPKVIPAGSKVWIEIEEDGVTKKGSLASK